MSDENKLYIQKYVEGFKDALLEGGRELRANVHKDWDVQKYGTYFENRSNGIEIRENADKGYDEGKKDAYATIGQDLHDHELKEYAVEDYGELYANVARKFGDCLECQDIGTGKGCEIGKTIWCPRLLETLRD